MHKLTALHSISQNYSLIPCSKIWNNHIMQCVDDPQFYTELRSDECTY